MSSTIFPYVLRFVGQSNITTLGSLVTVLPGVSPVRLIVLVLPPVGRKASLHPAELCRSLKTGSFFALHLLISLTRNSVEILFSSGSPILERALLYFEVSPRPPLF